MPALFWSEAVDEGLCLGWIDSKKKQGMIKARCSFLASENQKEPGRK